jgi:hypothetical protein
MKFARVFVWHSPTGLWLGMLQFGLSETREVVMWHAPTWEVLGVCYNMVSELQFSTLSLDGPCKWKLKQKFQSELLSKWTKFEFQSVHECQEGAERTP